MPTIKRNPDQLRRSATQVSQLGDQMTSARSKLDAAVAPARRGDVPELGQIEGIYSSLKTRMTRTNLVFDRSANTMRGYAALTEAQERMNVAWLAAVKAPKGAGRSRSASQQIAGDAWALAYARSIGLVPPGNSAADWARWSTLIPSDGSAYAVGSWAFKNTMRGGKGYLTYLQMKNDMAYGQPIKMRMTTGYGRPYAELTGRDHYLRPFNGQDEAQWRGQRDGLKTASKYMKRIGWVGNAVDGGFVTADSYKADRELGYGKEAAAIRGTVRGGGQTAGAIGGAWVGAKGGALAGGGVGFVIAGPPGAMVGAGLGGLAGGIGGGIAGSKLGKAAGEAAVDIADAVGDNAGDAKDWAGDKVDDGRKQAAKAAKKVGGWLKPWD